MDKPALTLYGRSNCHLCEDMLAALESWRGEFDFVVEVVDIDACPDKLARYDWRVPVLVLQGGEGEEEICHYFLDPAKVREVLGRFR